jgi:hypothetical protein
MKAYTQIKAARNRTSTKLLQDRAARRPNLAKRQLYRVEKMDSNHIEIALVPTAIADRFCGLRRLILSKVPKF